MSLSHYQQVSRFRGRYIRPCSRKTGCQRGWEITTPAHRGRERCRIVHRKGKNPVRVNLRCLFCKGTTKLESRRKLCDIWTKMPLCRDRHNEEKRITIKNTQNNLKVPLISTFVVDIQTASPTGTHAREVLYPVDNPRSHPTKRKKWKRLIIVPNLLIWLLVF